MFLFRFYDTETGKTDFIVNPAKEATEGAGPAAVQFIGSKKVEKVISGEFGLKIKSLLESLNIEMQREHDKTIAEIIQEIEKTIMKCQNLMEQGRRDKVPEPAEKSEMQHLA